MGIHPAHLHPNAIQLLMGCVVLNHLFNLYLMAIEVLLMYTVQGAIEVLFMIGLPTSGRGWAKGYVRVGG